MDNDLNNSAYQRDNRKNSDLPENKSLQIKNTIESFTENKEFLIENHKEQKGDKRVRLKEETKKPKINMLHSEKNFFVYGKNSKQNNISKEKRLLSASRKAQNLTSDDNKFSNKIPKIMDTAENRYSITYVNFGRLVYDININSNNVTTNNFNSTCNRNTVKNKSMKNKFFKKIISQESNINNTYNYNSKNINNNSSSSNYKITVTQGNNANISNNYAIGNTEQTSFNNVYAENMTWNKINNNTNSNVNNDTNTNANYKINSNNLNERKNKNNEKEKSGNLFAKGKGSGLNGSVKEIAADKSANILFNSNILNIKSLNINLKLPENKEYKTSKSKDGRIIKIKNSNFTNEKNNYKALKKKFCEKNIEEFHLDNNNNYNISDRTYTNKLDIRTFSGSNGIAKIRSKHFRFRESSKGKEKDTNMNVYSYNSTSGLEINKFKKKCKMNSDNLITINHCNNG